MKIYNLHFFADSGSTGIKYGYESVGFWAKIKTAHKMKKEFKKNCMDDLKKSHCYFDPDSIKIEIVEHFLFIG